MSVSTRTPETVLPGAPAGQATAALDPARSLGWRRLSSPGAVAALGTLLVTGVSGAVTALAAGWMAQAPTGAHFVVLLASLVGGTLIYSAGEIGWAAVVTRAEGRLRADLLTAALHQPVQVLGEQSAGEILDRVDDDTHAVGRLFRRVVWGAGRVVAGVVPTWIVAGVTWWPAWLLFPVLGVLVLVLARRRLAEIARRKVVEEQAWTDHAAAFEEAVAARDDLRTVHGQAFAVRRLAELSAVVHQRVRAVVSVEYRLLGSVGLLLQVLLGGVAVVGVALATSGDLGIGELVTLFLVTASLVGMMMEIVQFMPQIQEGVGAITRIRQLLDSAPEPQGGLPVPDGPLDVEISGLTFSYEDGGFALQDLSLAVPSGRTLALVGRTGSGKSTLASILSRAVEPPRGSVFLGGVDVLDLDLEALRSAVGVVTQRTELLAGTLAENITLFADVAPAVVEAAVADLGLGEWVAGLPQGLQTPLGPGGTRLSAGEEQLVAFARLLVRDVQVVVLDEATARMDPVTEARVVAASERLLTGRTGVLVAHRLTTIERADLVAVLERGRLVQHGVRSELALTAGPYRELLGAAVSGLVDDDATGDDPAGDDARGPLDPVDDEQGDDGPAATAVGGRRRTGPRPERRAPRHGMGLLRAVVHQFKVAPRWGLVGAAMYSLMSLTSAQAPVVGFLWGRAVLAVEEGRPTTTLLVALVLVLIGSVAALTVAVRIYARWWIECLLRVRMTVMRGQTEQRRLPATSPGEVVARAMDADRFVMYADRWIDFLSALVFCVVTAVLSGSALAGLVLLAIMAASALAATAGRPIAGRSATASAAARARFGRSLVSALDAARTVKLSARTTQVHAHLREVDAGRVDAAVFEHRVAAALVAVPVVGCHVAAAVAWFLYLQGTWDLPTTLLVSGSALGFIWFGLVSGAVVTEAPGTRAWQKATTAFADGANLVALPDGVSLVDGVAPLPEPGPVDRLESLELRSLTVAHDDDGTIGVQDLDLTVGRGELVLLLGQVGSGKSSLLAALAGLMSYRGEVRWNGSLVTDPERFLRPGRVAYVSQVPRVLSGTFAENIALDHPGRAVDGPIADARLGSDVADAGGLNSLVGHRGVRLSGGQVQRLALARALAADAELLLADDVSSALDAATEIELWEALRARGTTVVGSTSKRAALARADRVVVLVDGAVAAEGPWSELSSTWRHLAG